MIADTTAETVTAIAAAATVVIAALAAAAVKVVAALGRLRSEVRDVAVKVDGRMSDLTSIVSDMTTAPAKPAPPHARKRAP